MHQIKNYQSIYTLLSLFIIVSLIFAPLSVLTAEEGSETPPQEENQTEVSDTATPQYDSTGNGDTGSDGETGEGAGDGTAENPGNAGEEGTGTTDTDASSENTGESAENTPGGESADDTGTDGGNQGETEIDTGEVEGGINQENDVNTNQTSENSATSTDDGVSDHTTTTEPVTDTDDTDGTATSTPPADDTSATSTCPSGCSGNTNDTEIDIKNDNEADVSNDGSIDGSSGSNTANNNDNVTINTGNVNLLANVLNFINTNIVGSGWKFVIDIAEDFTNDLDLSLLTSTNVGGNITVENNNIATLNNSFTITGDSGNNTAYNNSGNVVINTGDVNIATNVINVVNSNLVNTQFLVTVINIWNNWAGDIVLPSQRLDVTYSEVPGTQVVENVDNENDATVVNNVDIEGGSGENETRTIHDATIDTGKVIVDNQITNKVNTNLINEQYLDTTVNIFGEWFGYITGLTDRTQYSENDYQVSITLADQNDPLPTDTGAYLSITNTNEATVVNDIDIDANTGGNTATGNGGNVHISTGNILALANIFNIINTNIVGGQFILALVNVFGEWTGDLAYGRPDLKITERLSYDDSGPLFPGDSIDVTFMYENNGDSQSTDVKIVDRFGDSFYINDANGGSRVGNGMIEFYIPDIEPGETGEVSYQLAVAHDIPFGVSHVSNHASIGGYEKDRNYSDNVTTASVSISRIHPYTPNTLIGAFIGVPNYNQNNVSSFSPAFTITKEHFAKNSTVFAGDEVSYQIRIKNTGSGDAPVVLVVDDLYDPVGTNVNSQGWDLGRVYTSEEVIFDYTIKINTHAYNGLYTNYAQVYYVDQQNNPLGSERVYTTIEVLGGKSVPSFSTGAGDQSGAEDVAPQTELAKNSVKVERFIDDTDDAEPAFTLIAPANAADIDVLGASTSQHNGWTRLLLIIILLIFAIAYIISYYVDRVQLPYGGGWLDKS